MDPHTVLGVAPGASPEEVTEAYRRMAKRHHPDHAGRDGKAIRDINAAYALLRDGLTRQRHRHGEEPPGRRDTPRHAAPWLAPALRIALGGELLRALRPGEDVRLVASAATWDAHDVRLVLTDRRLVWLRDDALHDRVRSVALAHLQEAHTRRGRRGRSGELRVRTLEGRRLTFADLRPGALAALERALQALSPAADT